jgi:hypothetical protein
MSEETGGLGGLFGGLKKRAAEAVERQAAAFVRGKVAGTTVTADDGTVIIEAGHVADDAAIERARAAGKLNALTASVGAAKMQDARDAVKTHLDRLPDGQEAHSLDTVEEYVEARRYVGRRVGVDVMDLRGAVVIPAGKELKDEDVRIAREQNLLGSLLYALQQPWMEPEAREEPPAPSEAPPPVKDPVPGRRASLPLLTPEDIE